MILKANLEFFAANKNGIDDPKGGLCLWNTNQAQHL